MSPKRVDIQAALRDPAQRKRLLAALFRSVKAIGRDGTHPLPPERHVMSAEQFKSLAQDMFSLASLKTSYIKMLYRLALLPPFRPAVYSRQPFVRYPYMYVPSHLIALNELLLSIQVPGAAIEVGCNQGWTTCWLLEALREAGINRAYHCLDTFTGFLAEDVAVEVNDRGKTAGAFAEYFAMNDQRWLDESLRRLGYTNVTTHKAEASTFDYRTIGPIAFALIDVDIYRPVKLSLQLVLPRMVKGGLIVVDDCDPKHALWDGAYQAYTEICRENGLSVEILSGKLGVIRI